LNPRRVELLVSVRNCDEIAAALAGGCDLLDFKEPEHGALGMVGPETLRAIKAYCTSQSVTQPLSMALGELVEWQDQPEMPCIPPAMRYLKMGLSQIQTLPDWQSCWQQVREQIESANQRHYDWIAVAYADWEQADSVPPLEILAAACDNRCAGLLLDTFGKQGTGLLELLSIEELEGIIARAHTAEMKIALAGSIRESELPALSALQPDIIGIRGAACAGHLRTSRIQESAVRQFRVQLDQQFAGSHSG
jgi:uncharacterized protein (UPF0264 family)